MNKTTFLSLITLLFTTLSFANEEAFTRANQKAKTLAMADLTQKTFLCYSHTERKTFVKTSNNNNVTLPLTYKNDSYQFQIVEIITSEGKKEGQLSVLKNGQHFTTQKVDFSIFDILGGNATVKTLPNLFCFFGGSQYFFDLAPFKNLAIGVHVLRSFNNDLNWFDKYTEYFKSLNMPVLISRQVGSTEKGMNTKFDAPFLESTPDVLADITQFESYIKTAPTGNQLFYSSTGSMPETIILSGSYFNYCMTKTLYSLARALSATAKNQMEVQISSEYSFAQADSFFKGGGIVKSLNIKRSLLSDGGLMSSYIKNSNTHFLNIVKNQKSFIEFNIFNGAELSYKEQGIVGHKTSNPQMQIFFR